MINNDNDASYVMNALPELKTFRKEDESEGRDFVSGRISRLSGIFENLSVDKIITPIKTAKAKLCKKTVTSVTTTITITIPACGDRRSVRSRS